MFSACEKEEAHQITEQTIQIEESTYEIGYIRNGLSKLLNIPLDKLIFDDSRNVFTHPDYDMILNPSEFISDIKVLEEEGYEF